MPLSGKFGRYRIDRVLGKGGMGEVYLAHDTTLNRRMALKVPKIERGESEMLARFLREARAAAKLPAHPNLCPIYDVGEIDGQHFISMEYVEGETLASVLARRGPFPWPEAVALVRKLATIFQVLHAAGFVHRNLKSANIMIRENAEPVVMDLGLVRTTEDKDKLGQNGTPGYMSPEQVRGKSKDIGVGTDVYSLGVILFELVTGRLPFAGDSSAILDEICTKKPPPPSKFNGNLNPALDGVCARALAKNPAERFKDMAEFGRELAKLESAGGKVLPKIEPATAAPAAEKEKSAKRKQKDKGASKKRKSMGSREANPKLVFAAIGVVLVLSIGGWFIWQSIRRSSEPAVLETAKIDPAKVEGKPPVAVTPPPKKAEIPIPKKRVVATIDKLAIELPMVKDGASVDAIVRLEVRSIMDEVNLMPPIYGHPIVAAPAVVPYVGMLKGYDADYSSLKDLEKMAKDVKKYPLRAAYFDAVAAIKEGAAVSVKDYLPGPSSDALKKQVEKWQNDTGLLDFKLKSILANLDDLHESGRGREKSKRWLAHFDYARGMVTANILFLNEYNFLLSRIRADSMPALGGAPGWELVLVKKLTSTESAIKNLNKRLPKLWDEIGNAYPETPWAALARHESLLSRGLEWRPLK